jgi:acetyl-CoA acetyltransferase
MAEYQPMVMPPALPQLSRKAAIVGIGESDYHADYRAQRKPPPDYQSPTTEGMAVTVFERALADAGLTRGDVDGLTGSFTYGGPEPAELASLLGIKPRWNISNGNIMAGPLPVVCAAIAEGKADCVAMIYAVNSRSSGRVFGGATHPAGSAGTSGDGYGTPPSYYYCHPWGWSSQAAHWAMIAAHYSMKYGVREEDLGAVAQQVRLHASRNPNAVMQKPFSIEEYMASRYIVKPLHLLDICLVNDGAVCLIVRRSDQARDMAKVPVDVAGWGEARVKHSKFDQMVRQQLRPQLEEAGGQAFAMAGMSRDDIGHFEGYDAGSIHLINQIEGYGFAKPGEGVAFCQAGEMDLTGRLPSNTEGGNMSCSYMHGWSQVAETVRQLRGEAGARQVTGLTHAMTSLAQTDQAHPILYARGDI